MYICDWKKKFRKKRFLPLLQIKKCYNKCLTKY
jgi:hypothetical protein